LVQEPVRVAPWAIDCKEQLFTVAVEQLAGMAQEFVAGFDQFPQLQV
jgi:hypothetical protein